MVASDGISYPALPGLEFWSSFEASIHGASSLALISRALHAEIFVGVASGSLNPLLRR